MVHYKKTKSKKPTKVLYHQIPKHQQFVHAGRTWVRLGRTAMDENGEMRPFKDSDYVTPV